MIRSLFKEPLELRPYQKESVNALWSWFRANPQGAPVLVWPTGAGKSIAIAEIARAICARGLDRRVLVIAHRKELLEQNFAKLQALMPFANCGLYSAGLQKKESSAQVVVAGIQSAYKKAEELGKFSLVIVDEVHLCKKDGDGMYGELFEGLKKQNPAIRLLGLTASPFRLDSGIITNEGSVFTAIAHELKLKDLTEQGYLAPLKGKAGKAKANLALVAKRAGEYAADEMEKAFNKLDLVEAALEEVVSYGHDRKHWLLFASGVQHAENIEKVLKRVGITCAVVTGDTPPLIRNLNIQDFKTGKIRALINVNVLSVGFDFPGIDLIAVLRATMSVSLWLQMCGRGCRIAPEKEDCLVLDFGQNITRHGPLDMIRITSRYNPLTEKEEHSVETTPVKECLGCGSIMVASAMECPDCGFVFPITIRHEATASNASIMSEPKKVYTGTVTATRYAKHQSKKTGKYLLRVEYTLSPDSGAPIGVLSKYVCFPPEYRGWAVDLAVAWWDANTKEKKKLFPLSLEEVMERVSELQEPKTIEFKEGKGGWEVVKYVEFKTEEEVMESKREEEETYSFFEEEGINL